MISIIVVLYGKEISDSVTLNTLKCSRFFENKDQLVIVNNGPSYIKTDVPLVRELSLKFDIEILNKINNEPLSSLYNWFLEKYENDYYVIFDDDTTVPTDFLNNIKKPLVFGGDITLPIIMSGEKVNYYPYVNNIVINEEYTMLHQSDVVKSISSGLTFSNRVVALLKEEFGDVFDESYALYGVDSSFFSRVNRIREKLVDVKICIGMTVQHSLSRVDKKISKSNWNERIIDMAISLKKYPESISLKDVVKTNIKLVLLGSIGHIPLFFSTYFKGSHPRSKKR